MIADTRKEQSSAAGVVSCCSCWSVRNDVELVRLETSVIASRSDVPADSLESRVSVFVRDDAIRTE